MNYEFTTLYPLEIQSGQVTTPNEEAAAAGDSALDVPQRAISIGEPVPIVFARRRNGQGGVLVSPGATEARFENDNSNAVTAYYHLVLSEGEIDPIPVKDVFQRSCRTGTHIQTYNRRAGTWAPGNAIVARDGYSLPVAPYYCGTTGAFPDISTMSFQSGAIPDGFDLWNRQVHVFVRGGMHVARYEDSSTGPSDSFADLYRWMLDKTSRVPAELIDEDGLEAADTFLRANGFTCNCWITGSQNLAEWGIKWAPYFLLVTSSANGKRGLRPVLPTTVAGAIETGPITPVFTFNEDTIIPNSFSVQYISMSERQPFVAQMIWKQTLEDDIGIVRTSDVRIAGTAYDGPFESHDLSEFCTSENHAAKVGAYIVAKRIYTTHTATFTTKPGEHGTLATPGSIVRVRLVREGTGTAIGYHDYLYQVERVSKTLAGDLGYECTHFPINDLGQSIVALSIAGTEASGVLMSSNRTGVTCDVNSSDDDSLPDDEGTPIDWDTDVNPYGEPVDLPDFFEPDTDPFAPEVPIDDGVGGGGGGGYGSNEIDGGTGGSDGDGLSPGIPGGGGAFGIPIYPGNELEADPDAGDAGDDCTLVFLWYSIDPDTGAIIKRKSATIGPGGGGGGGGSGDTETSYIVLPEDEGLEVHFAYSKFCPGDTEPESGDKNYGVVQSPVTPPVPKNYTWSGTFTSTVTSTRCSDGYKVGPRESNGNLVTVSLGNCIGYYITNTTAPIATKCGQGPPVWIPTDCVVVATRDDGRVFRLVMQGSGYWDINSNWAQSGSIARSITVTES
jgi:hypothetical protein